MDYYIYYLDYGNEKIKKMNRENYFKEKAFHIVGFVLLGTLAAFTMDDAHYAVRIIVPVAYVLVSIGILLYGLIKYKK